MEGLFTDCKSLRAEHGPRAMQPRSAAILKSVRHANPGIVNDTVACGADPKNPVCARVRRNTGDRVVATNRVLAHAQQQNFRSVEAAVNRSATRRVLYDQAVCTKLQQQAGSNM